MFIMNWGCGGDVVFEDVVLENVSLALTLEN